MSLPGPPRRNQLDEYGLDEGWYIRQRGHALFARDRKSAKLPRLAVFQIRRTYTVKDHVAVTTKKVGYRIALSIGDMRQA
jgi:hypothetical protein